MCQLYNIDDKNMNKPTEQQIEEVLAGIATPEIARTVAQWFATDEGSAYLTKHMEQDTEQIKLGFEELYVDHRIDSDKMLTQIRQNTHRKRVRRIIFRVAAVLFPVAILLGMFLQVDSQVDLFGNSGYEEVYVPKGERIQMMFQDGTRVYINSDSRLKYPKKFGLTTREVSLQGQAYFVVAKNKHRPFIVNLNGPAIHVLGTSFDVHAYPTEKNITVYLDEGSINLISPSENKYILRPGEKLIYDRANSQCVITQNDSTGFPSLWKKDMIALKNTSLAETIKILNRWYNVDFKVQDSAAWEVSYTITCENTLLEKVLSDLEKIAPLKFEYNENKREVLIKMK